MPDAWREWQALDGSIKQALKPLLAKRLQNPHGLETFGADLELVRSLDQNHVWSVMESGCDDDLWITSGIHYVNRICYLVTEKAHNGLAVDFRVPHNLRSLSPLGLKRQILKIERGLNQLNLAVTP